MTWYAAGATALQAMNARKQGKEAYAAGRYNAALLDREATDSQMQAVRDEETMRRAARALKGKQRAAMAESGGGGGGTDALLAAQSDAAAELDALNVRYGGTLRAQNLRSRADMERRYGANASAQSGMLAGAQLLRGASDLYTGYRLSH